MTLLNCKMLFCVLVQLFAMRSRFQLKCAFTAYLNMLCARKEVNPRREDCLNIGENYVSALFRLDKHTLLVSSVKGTKPVFLQHLPGFSKLEFVAENWQIALC